MYFPLVFEVISYVCYCLTPATPFLASSTPFWAVIGQSLVFILSAGYCTSFTLAVPLTQLSIYSISGLSHPPSPSPAYLLRFLFMSIIEAVETLLATTHVATSVENLDTGLGTVDPCFGQDAASPPATIAILDSPTTSRPEASQASSNQSSEDDLAQVERYELESSQ